MYFIIEEGVSPHRLHVVDVEILPTEKCPHGDVTDFCVGDYHNGGVSPCYVSIL